MLNLENQPHTDNTADYAVSCGYGQPVSGCYGKPNRGSHHGRNEPVHQIVREAFRDRLEVHREDALSHGVRNRVTSEERTCELEYGGYDHCLLERKGP